MQMRPPDPDTRATALVNARLVDPGSGLDQTGGVLVADGKIVDLGPHIGAGQDDAEIVDCGGHVLAPGLVDMLVFSGEPGHEHRETLATASRAAAAGGVTTIVCMPNTDPVIDDVALVDFILRRARDTAVVNIHPMAAMTKGLLGEEMTEIGLLREAGAIAFTNGKRSLASAKIMRNVLSYAKDFGALIIHHVEDPSLAGDGVMNEGEISTRLGLRGVPAAAEAHHARARRAPRRADRRPLPRRPDLLPRLARHHPRGQGPRPADYLRRFRQPSHPQRERHRLLPDLLQVAAAASLGGRPARRWSRASRAATST